MTCEHEIYSSDSPVLNHSQDQFNRYPFAKRVASVISKRKDPSSIVIGIYGAWGEGKTSVFNFIDGELNKEEHVVCIRFNPWRYGEEEQMLINFFNEMAASIDRTIETGSEKIGVFINKFVKPAATIVGKGDVAEGVSSLFTNADIEKLRGRIEAVLEEEKKRVVILIDDIDRLEKNEIHAVFRLVKLTADFKYTAYVLAFDKEMVSSALQERYGGGNQNAGKAFLEKIIQVPLQLPAIDSNDLRTFCLRGVDTALELAEIKLTEEQVQLFVNNFTSIEKQLKTPRQAMLYSNILTFSLPILKGEVSPVDLMLIEGLRVFSPEVYELIRNNKEIFINEPLFGYRKSDEEAQRRKQKIETVLNGFSLEIAEEIKKVLLFLFPRLNNIFGNTHYGADWEKSWNKNQRICTNQYFQRYFTYSIPRRDISDQVIRDLMRYTEDLKSEELAKELDTKITPDNVDILILKIRSEVRTLTKEQAGNLAIAVSKLGHKFPNPVTFLSANTFVQGAMLITDCIESIDGKEEQINLAIKICKIGEPLNFAVECFRWLRRDTEKHPNPKGFSDQEIEVIGKELAGRISEEFEDKSLLFDGDISMKFPQIFYIWNKFGEPSQQSEFLRKLLEENSNFAQDLLESYLGTTWGSDGIPKKSNFERSEYESIIQVIDPEFLVSAIKKVYGELPIEKDYPDFIDVPFKEKLVKQFLWIHHFVINEVERKNI
ncbi:KAP family P-loop NTPase fold protein [Mesobacillus selenatarsenatis]|uniref:Phage T7 exclusion protein n=1 Tax=Mesobacillus selenatarsenatis (strain DSM 18680 / JCM 14380 / FERM P-15431 / SF-1) TaxID=1321606 RepID=A0A0A8X3W5_MESS1|nr:P-loop NTPase fold protein [Mesobacillus selenatarsenatis]GAM14685.1 phage T7 exclusion protein [Mesobacillus selenatarsenatis SF-1]